MTQPGEFTPYSTVKPWLSSPPGWVPATDKDRIGAYQVYEEMYWSHVSTTYKVMTRDDSEGEPLYVPSSRIIVETVNRYVGKGMQIAVVPESGTPATRALATQALANLFARERFYSRYDANKRWGMVAGDWVWHILADPNKAPGTRIRILAVDAASYFPVTDPNDPDRIIKVHLAERILVGDTYLVKRQTYEKADNGRIISSAAMYAEDQWFVDGGTVTTVIQAPTELPPEITAIPVYHVPHNWRPGVQFGSSEIRGLETIAAGLNQGVTDSDLALALMGLGVYATDQPGSPRNADGTATSWFVYPGAVIENSKGLRRVEGITSLTPYDSHLGRLWSFAQEASGANPAAMGNIDVTEAESGVALYLKLAPILAKAEEQDRFIRDVHLQMMFDLQRWFQAYEKINFTDVVLLPTFGDKIPKNKKAELELIAAMMATIPPLISAQSGRNYLRTVGFDMFAEDEEERVMVEQQQVAQVAQGQDPLAVRAGEELAADKEPPGVDSEATEAPTGTEG
jgi:hypothetical protein